MTKREKLLGGLSLDTMPGIEIGALHAPIVLKSDGPVFYVDFADAEYSRKKYLSDPGVDVSKIVDVDVIIGAEPLSESLAVLGRLDYVVASHVIEQVPDLITWLHELRISLSQDGTLRLVVPDKRFTFDHIRRETQLADVTAAFLQRQRKPSAIAMLDFYLNYRTVDCVTAWRGQIDPAALTGNVTPRTALQGTRDALEADEYRDVHCWVFTPASLAALFLQLCELDLMPFRCEAFYDTERYEFDFVVVLRASGDQASNAESWRRMREAARNEPDSPF